VAFDSADRNILMKTIRKKGIRKGSVIRIEEIIRKTKNKNRRTDKRRILDGKELDKNAR